ncbi:Transcriptional regulator, PadR-like family OS=Tsukamurella paurometabola (strain ATCC 8368 / DSM / CCUG 35730 / CIP 100753 / JCM 10117 / KCTC 9821 / NBRC 16120 / NCIMB 702349 / NCTC 13040) OX=521096 GN=Tpau_0613 PE=4 SV=1 [Tsukamurella paurometabola]|uniref:Transcriptional regulator, PadR-like family n=1 Tax=Tsukamurella paurometabola (strain ATCC 8368 / DSM 20162 / CCUG 35730 / CIP 100753 / JCM 10117 / KCTC 9821 / NBRC 16120 / NCIMB 702349 / NCTC 13040) TaxID=521096 RepID=D5USW4_TSUPD|nr:PadR family transcriptional regulator [Tsukamurella paurometabola]ADG77251.1 transcriptional regulator, PadR-like family [Tsukamurella paurometabola DSM 20162]SUP43284.1 transcriptional regulator, Acidobacterial, PadR-family [Tsukamurella paurometabola]
MALRHAILATLLVVEEASGYDLAKEFDGARAHFWTATPQQLYRELDRMEADGAIVARTVEQEKRPNKRVFRVTADGRTELAAFSERSPKPMAIRDDFLVMVQGAQAGDVAAICANLRLRRDAAAAKLAHYERVRARWLEGRTEAGLLADHRLGGPYLTLLRGLRFEQENLDWYDLALPVLEARLP